MPNTVTVTMTNDSNGQQIFFATDNVMNVPAPIEGAAYQNGYPLPSGQTVNVTLVVDQYGHGQATGGYGGNMLMKNGLNDGDSLYP